MDRRSESSRARCARSAQVINAPFEFLLLAIAHLRRDIRARNCEGAGLTAAAVIFQHPAVDLRVHQLAHDFERIVLFDR